MTPSIQNYFSTIPLRLAAAPDEWIETYLVRVARSFGLNHPTEDDIDRLRQIYATNNTPTERISGYFSELPSWAKKKLGAQIRYCPACFQKDRIVRTRWRIPLYEMCTEHSLNLKIDIVEPSLGCEYNYPGAIRLNNISNDQIWEGATCPLPAERNAALTIWQKFDFEINQSKIEANESLAWIIAAENLLDAIVSSPVGSEIPLKHGSRLRHRAEWLSNNGLSIAPSFDGILKFLGSIKNYREKRVVATRLKYMVRDCENGVSILKLLPLQDLYSRFLAIRPDVYCPIANGALPAHLQPKGYLSLNLAEGLLGQRSKFLYFLLRSNFFKKIEKIKNGGRTYVFLHETEVEGCRRWLGGCMTPTQVMEYLQIDREMYLGLLLGGILQPIEMGRWSLFRRDQIGLIANKFDSVSRPVPLNLQVHPFLKSLLKNKERPARVFNQLIEQIWMGKIPLYKNLDKNGLSAFYVDRSALEMAKRLMVNLLAEQHRRKFFNHQPSLLENIC